MELFKDIMRVLFCCRFFFPRVKSQLTIFFCLLAVLGVHICFIVAKKKLYITNQRHNGKLIVELKL
jgi:hypothetical protein